MLPLRQTTSALSNSDAGASVCGGVASVSGGVACVCGRVASVWGDDGVAVWFFGREWWLLGEGCGGKKKKKKKIRNERWPLGF
ncbi:unnamed protein product [Linum trigynum]|uniref:Secreted protein n=1 Tax=Linum trigynum TaxID=586398 RepID=A0AAV2EJI6_9ROSI